MYKIFDAHFHIIDSSFPLFSNHGYKPKSYLVKDYQEELAKNGIKSIGGVIVSGSFQGNDYSYFKPAFKELGSNYVGIINAAKNITDKKLSDLNSLGIRGIRFNFYRGHIIDKKEVEELSKYVFNSFGWSTEFYLDLAKTDTSMLKFISSLPKSSIDHLGMSAKVDQLKFLLSKGVAIRLTGFGRLNYDKNTLKKLLPVLYQENPKDLLFGTDLPSTRSKMRFTCDDLELVNQAFANDKNKLQNIFYENGASWYLGKYIQ